jgi:L-Ala-D/L-Glu epimerase
MSDARRLLGRVDVFNVRIGKCGGLLAAREIIHFASAHGIGVQLGVMVGETSIAGTAGRLLAACSPELGPLEFDESDNLAFDVVREPLARVANNRAPVPPLQPGLGCEIALPEARVA